MDFPSGETDNTKTVEHESPKCLGKEVSQVILCVNVNQLDYPFRNFRAKEGKSNEDVLHSLVTSSLLTKSHRRLIVTIYGSGRAWDKEALAVKLTNLEVDEQVPQPHALLHCK